jgi:glutamyl-tRNA synthetase
MLRFAPSPTGSIHIGNLRVAIFNYILSKKLNKKLIIRIEDTDKNRNIKGKDKEIINMLDIFNIEYQYIIYQSHNLNTHKKMAMRLLLEKKAFNCFCNEEKLGKLKEKFKKEKIPFRYDGTCENLDDYAVMDNQNKFTVRIKKPNNSIRFKDKIKGDFNINPFDVDSFIILREDKTPTYNYACAIDDMLCNITTVIRGEDHLSNTSKQIHIRQSLGYEKDIEYIHLPMILNEKTGKKMSKRDNESSVKWLIDKGFLPISIANYIVLLGNKTPKEIFTLEDAISWFDINKISKSPAKFDINKLRFINNEHLKLIDNLRLSKILGFSDESIGKLAKLYLEESSTINEIRDKINLIFSRKEPLVEYIKEFKILKICLKKAPYFDEFTDLKRYIVKETQLKGKSLFKPLRYIITNRLDGPDLSKIYPLIKNYLGEIIK